MDDLLPHLELPQCHCLNASSAHPLRNCLATEARDDAALVLQSDCDEELLLSLRFMTTCRVSAITVEAPTEGAPTGLSLFVNKIGLDFDSAKTDTPTQVPPPLLPTLRAPPQLPPQLPLAAQNHMEVDPAMASLHIWAM